MPGTLFVVATPIGNLEDVTMRALRVLREVEAVAAEDTRRTGLFLQHFGITTPTISLHDHNERAKTPALVERLVSGASVALVSDAGTPLLSDPGLRLVRAAHDAGVPVVPVPGASAITAALSISGVPVNTFTFLGFAPARAAERDRWLEGVKDVAHTLVYFEAPHRIRESLEAVGRALGDRFVVVARELTKLHESVARGWLSSILETGVEERGELTIVVSDLIKPADTVRTAPTDEVVRAEFGVLTKNDGLSGKDAATRLALKYGLSRQQIYKVVSQHD